MAFRPLPPFPSVDVAEPASSLSISRCLPFFVVLPHSQPRFSLFHFIINSLCLLATLDCALQPHFDQASLITYTRLGAVLSDSAKIVVRYPPVPHLLPAASNVSANTSRHDVRVVWREVRSNGNATWKASPLVVLEQSEDWVSTAKLIG